MSASHRLDGDGDQPEKKHKRDDSEEALKAQASSRERKARKLFESRAPKIREEKDYAGMMRLVCDTLRKKHYETPLSILPPKDSTVGKVKYCSIKSSYMGLGAIPLKINLATGEVVTMGDKKPEAPINVLDITIENILAM
jgi:hypothetical protein